MKPTENTNPLKLNDRYQKTSITYLDIEVYKKQQIIYKNIKKKPEKKNKSSKINSEHPKSVNNSVWNSQALIITRISLKTKEFE